MPVQCTCQTCGATFSVASYRAGTAIYCSRTCQGIAQRRRSHSTCEYCGKPYERKASQVGRFCSYECSCMASIRPATERFWSKVDKSGECWLWTANKDRRGYGQFFWQGRPQIATHFAWELANGPIPDGLWVLHRCDVPSCVRVEHLFLGTHTDNMQDMIAKGRQGRVPHDNYSRGEHRWSARLTASQVLEIRERHAQGAATPNELAAEFGVTASNIYAITQRKSWKHIA